MSKTEIKLLPTAGLLMLKEDKLLLTYSKNKKAWYLPGGKLDEGEDSLTALIREVKEELGVQLDPQKLHYRYHISAPAFGEDANIIMEQDCYQYPAIDGLCATNEIEDFKYFSWQEYLKEPKQVIGVIKAFEFLHQDKIL